MGALVPRQERPIPNARIVGEIAAGLIYLDDEAEELRDAVGATARPLNELPERELYPGSKALEAINASLR
jgi:2-oxoglutarate/2-oxoacid ferredoxin oxidoreductase subunit beta